MPGRKKKPPARSDAVMFTPSDRIIELDNAPVIDHDTEVKNPDPDKGAEQGRNYLDIDDIDFDEEEKWQRPPQPGQVHGPSGEEGDRNVPDESPGRSMHCPKCGKVISLPEFKGSTVITCSHCGAQGRIRF